MPIRKKYVMSNSEHWPFLRHLHNFNTKIIKSQNHGRVDLLVMLQMLKHGYYHFL